MDYPHSFRNPMGQVCDPSRDMYIEQPWVSGNDNTSFNSSGPFGGFLPADFSGQVHPPATYDFDNTQIERPANETPTQNSPLPFTIATQGVWPLDSFSVIHKCNWRDCTSAQTFTRKSEYKRHMEKHTRPYICNNPVCNSPRFGDKSGLQRHEREKHGGARFQCPWSKCPRYLTGFARKSHLKSHMGTHHHSSGASTEEADAEQDDQVGVGSPQPNPEEVLQHFEVSMEGAESSNQGDREMNRLQGKLLEKETERTELVSALARKEADIEALKRAIELVSA